MSDPNQRRGLLSGCLTDKELKTLQEELELKNALLVAKRAQIIADIKLQFRNDPKTRDMLLRPLQLKRGPKPKRTPGSLSGYPITQAKKVSARFTGGLLGGSFQMEKPKRGRKQISQEITEGITYVIARKREELRQHKPSAKYYDAALAILTEVYKQKYGKEPGNRDGGISRVKQEARKLETFFHNHKRNLSSR
jgi:hypothetical protein